MHGYLHHNAMHVQNLRCKSGPDRQYKIGPLLHWRWVTYAAASVINSPCHESFEHKAIGQWFGLLRRSIVIKYRETSIRILLSVE